MALQLTFLPQARATPVFTTAQCNVPASNLWNTDPGDPIAVYIESDFGSELDSCVTTGDADGISDLQARNVIRAAMEVWNREARSAVFHYAGTKSYEEITSANCSNFSENPAVYIRFEEGCDNSSDCGAATACVGSLAHARSVVDCANVIQLTILGDFEERADCGDDRIQWNVTGESEGGGCNADLMSTLIHELGHTLALGHPEQASGGDATSGHSVMNQGSSYPRNRHLFPWDMDCVDDAISSGDDENHRGVRSVTYKWKGLDSTGAWVGSIETEISSTKGFLAAAIFTIPAAILQLCMLITHQMLKYGLLLLAPMGA